MLMRKQFNSRLFENPSPPMTQTNGQPPSRRFVVVWRIATTVLVTLFVVWHLLFLLVRNIAGLAEEPVQQWAEEAGIEDVYEPVNEWTTSYELTLGLDQGWAMFTAPLARTAPFPAIRIEFDDGTTEDFLSDNEPQDLGRFWRFGGARMRKYEHFLATTGETRKDGSIRGSYRRPLWEQYVRWRLAQWRERNPDDPRTPAKILFIRRRFTLPAPGENPNHFDPPSEKIIARFAADGDLLP